MHPFKSSACSVPDRCYVCLLSAPIALYAVIAENYPRFVQEIERCGSYLPQSVRREFEDYLKCGLLEHGFLRVKCDGCRHVPAARWTATSQPPR